MAILHLCLQIGRHPEQVLVVVPYLVLPEVVLVPRFVVVARIRAKSAHDPFQVMGILKPDVLLDDGQPFHGKGGYLGPALEGALARDPQPLQHLSWVVREARRGDPDLIERTVVRTPRPCPERLGPLTEQT